MTGTVHPNPKYAQLKELLKGAIAQGEFPMHSPLPTQRVLMEQHHLSFTTVRRALEDLVREGVAYSRPGKGIYVAGPANAVAQGRRVFTLVGFQPSWFSGHPRGWIVGLLEAQHEFEFLMHMAAGDSLADMEASLHAGKRPSDGAIVMCLAGQVEQLVAKMNEDRFPYVILDMPVRRTDVNAVVFDHEAGAFDVVTHLIHRRHRRIAFIGGTPGEDASQAWDAAKYRGYARALRRVGVTPCAEDMLLIEDYQDSRIDEYVKHIVRGLCTLRRAGVTAAFIALETLARGTLAGLAEAGVRVPEDLAIVGFNRLRVDAPGLPTLTTVDIPLVEAGPEAVRLLIGLIEGRESFPAQRALRGRLIVGESSGAGPK